MKIIMNEKELELLKSSKSHILIQNMFFENDLSFLFALFNEY